MATKKATTTRAAKMREYYTANPTATVSQVAKKFKTTYQIAYMCKKGMEKRLKDAQQIYELTKGRKEQRMKILAITSSNTPLPSITMIEPPNDPVNHPAHYKVGGIETIDFIEAKKLNYNMGNAVKYISRADHKGNKKQDLEKAKWYIDRELAKT
jgi:hypothetical protein